jgi:hypothetical protein
VKPGELEIATEGDGAQPFKKQVEGVPVDTKLTQTCPDDVNFNGTATVRGNLSPAFAGAKIAVSWTRPQGRGTVDHEVTTDAQGNFTDTVDTLDDDPGGNGNGGQWSVSSSYGGDSTHNPSQSTACPFTEIGG